MARVKTNPILLLSPLDPTCQSGLIRDALLVHQLGKTTIAICTSIANQNDVEIDDLTVLSFEEIKRQLHAVGRRYWLDWAVLSGIQDLNLVAALIRYLEQNRPGIRLLWHPELQHTERSYHEQLNNQEQELFDILCKKVYTVFLDRRDLLLLSAHESPEQRLSSLSESTFLYLAGDTEHTDSLYIHGKESKQSFALRSDHHIAFLPVLSCFLYDGNEISDACRQSFLFLSNNSIK